MAAPAAKKQKTYDNTAFNCSQCKKIAAGQVPILWENEHYLVVHKRPPCGVVGHLQVLSKRHFQGPSSMTDEEAASIGPTLKKVSAVLERVTQCDRLYTAALGSAKSGSHFHAHVVPLYVEAGEADAAGTPPISVTGTPFDLFLQEKLAADKAEGAAADESKCAAIAAAFQAAMAEEEAVCKGCVPVAEKA